MKFIISSILILCMVTSLFSQIENYPKYRKFINQAESHLISNKKDSALLTYQNAFSSIKGNHVKDIYNSLNLAYELNKKSSFFKLLDLMIIKDLDSKVIKKKFNKYHNDSRWRYFIKRNDTYVAPKRQLKLQFDSLHVIDQKFRTMPGSYKVYGDTINKIDSLNHLFLQALCDNNEFPGEDEMGVSNFSGIPGCDIVFTHLGQRFSKKHSRPNMINEIFKLIQEGRAQPNIAMEWISDHGTKKYSYGTSEVFCFKSKTPVSDFRIVKMKDENIELFNNNRTALGLPSICEYLKQCQYQEEYKKPYILNGLIIIYSGLDKNMKSMFLDRSTPLLEYIDRFCQ